MRLDPITLTLVRVKPCNQDFFDSVEANLLYELMCRVIGTIQVTPDDHSEVVPLLPIPNRTVKRLSADDSADSRVKVGHRQASMQNARS